MRVVLALVLTSAGLLVPASGAADDSPPREAFLPTRLHPLPAQARIQCLLARRLARCPARLPRATIPYLRGRRVLPPLTAERYRAGRNGNAVLVGMSFAYGAPWEPDSGPDWRQHLWRNRPCCFLHFEIWRALEGKPPFPERFGRARLGGHAGDLAPATGHGLACGPGNAGVFFCNHTRFRWREDGVWFVASLHRFGAKGETESLLGRLIRELRAR